MIQEIKDFHDPSFNAKKNARIADAIRKRYSCGKCRRDWLGEGATDLFNASQYDYDHLFKKGLMELLLKICRKRLARKQTRKNLFFQLLRDVALPSNCSADPTNYFKRLDKKGALKVGSDVSMDELHYVFLIFVHCGQHVLPDSLYALCVEFWRLYVAITDARGLAEDEVNI
jgi:hypothetical protein